MKTAYFKFVHAVSRLDFLALLMLRLVLVAGLYKPAIYKYENFAKVIPGFENMGMPFPALSAGLVTGTEVLALVLLTLGLGVRFIAVPLMITLLVAIFAVHWPNGFDIANKGYEKPLYYFVMTFVLFVYGGGKAGLDYWIGKRMRK